MVKLVKQNLSINKKIYNKKITEIKKKIGNKYIINHVGSTSIPYMYGKNIIDILIGVNTYEDLEKVTKELIGMGYCPGSSINDSKCRFFANTDEETKSGDIHIHVAIKDSDRYREFIILRDYLLNNKVERKNYSNFKKEILKKGNNDREDYKRIKSEYVDELLKRAISWHNNRK